MCCFSRPVLYVAQTRIFARRVSPERQTLVYQMTVQTQEPTAMILPLPVRLPAREDDVHFVSLKPYPGFFADVARLFQPPRPRSSNKGGGDAPRAAAAPRLVVHEIGEFVASFVPTMKDFSRLDPRFVIKPEVWKQIPGYDDYGFAVFQLKTPDGTQAQVHPMAFSFATRHADKLFFPTVHIHDGTVHKQEKFDHQLYAQGNLKPGAGWQGAYFRADQRVNIVEAKNMIHATDPVLLRTLVGTHANADVFVVG
jgi:hypothetical protein